MRASVVLTCCVLGGWMFATAVEAQDDVARPVKLSVSLRADYTDNRDSMPSDMEESNWDFYVRPRVDIFLNGERTLFSMHCAPAWRHRTDPSVIQHDDELWLDLGMAVEHSMTPAATVRAMNQFDYADDPSVDSGGVTVRRDQSYILNRTEAGVNYDLNDVWNADLLGRYMDKSFERNEVAEDSDETRADGQVTMTRSLSPSLFVSALGSFSAFGFDSASGIERDFNSVLGALGVEQIINNHLRVGAKAGAQMQDYDDNTIDEQTEPYVELYVRCQNTPATRMTAQIERGVRDADAYPYASQVYTEARARLEWDPVVRVTLGVGAAYRRSDYDEIVPSAPESAFYADGEKGGTEDRVVGEASAAYRFDNAMSLTLAYLYEDLDSDVDLSFEKNTVRLTLGREF
jgi:hypothetical protein